VAYRAEALLGLPKPEAAFRMNEEATLTDVLAAVLNLPYRRPRPQKRRTQ
jgi:RecB family exonuclease